MPLDPVTNFAKVTLNTGYDADDINVTLVSGDGALLPDPATDGAFNLVWYNDTDYSDPTDDPNKEITRCTAKSGDNLTLTRAQEGTSASTKNASGKTYKMLLSVTKKMIDDIRTGLNSTSWVYEYIPGESVGSNLVFTIPVDASRVIVYADGYRVRGSGVDYTFSSNDTITFVNAARPRTTISIDYLPL